jgi:hypothetical protein
MGTQQSLLMLLSIILVFVAVTVGISIYNNITRNTFIKNCVQELTYFKARATDYYKTSQYMGGSSFGEYQWNAESLAYYIGIGHNGSNEVETDYAHYIITIVDYNVTILAEPKEGSVTTNIQLEYNVLTNEAVITYPE